MVLSTLKMHLLGGWFCTFVSVTHLTRLCYLEGRHPLVKNYHDLRQKTRVELFSTSEFWPNLCIEWEANVFFDCCLTLTIFPVFISAFYQVCGPNITNSFPLCFRFWSQLKEIFLVNPWGLPQTINSDGKYPQSAVDWRLYSRNTSVLLATHVHRLLKVDVAGRGREFEITILSNLRFAVRYRDTVGKLLLLSHCKPIEFIPAVS